jgi:hypothetical protein
MTKLIISSFISGINLNISFSAYCLLVSALHSFQVLRSIDTILKLYILMILMAYSSMLTETLQKTKSILHRLKQQIGDGIPVIGAGAGTGISAKFEEAGGVDLIVLYNSGRFRMAGRGSLAGLLPFADANAIVLEMANEVLPVSFIE